jgi:hypothetical protein
MFGSADSEEVDKSFAGILSVLEGFVSGLEPAEYARGDVPVVLRRITKAEKLCAAARLLMSRRAAELFAGDGEGTTSTAKWLASQRGEGVGKSRRDLEMAQKLESQPELEEALRSGSVSPTQAFVLLPALEADPDASERLIKAAEQDSLNELRQQCQRVVAAKTSEEEAEARDARLRERRHLRIGTTEDGAVSIRGELPPVEGAAVKNALLAMKAKIFDEARRAGRRESHEAYMADALVAICRAEGGLTPSSGAPRAEIVLHVSAEALRRGELESGEICEIEGVGPVPLSTVEYLFGDSWAKLIILNGVDIASVTHFGRFIPAHLETALSKRDLVCAVPGCGISYGLERDHIIPVSEGGRTELANLVKVCRRHHYLKTHHFWRLTGTPGTWKWVNIRHEQEVVADGDLFDVARPGEPVAGLGRPVLRPREPVFSVDDTPDVETGDDTTGEPTGPTFSQQSFSQRSFSQQTFAWSARGPVVVLRITPALLAELAGAGEQPADPEQPPLCEDHGQPADSGLAPALLDQLARAGVVGTPGEQPADPGRASSLLAKLPTTAGADSPGPRDRKQRRPRSTSPRRRRHRRARRHRRSVPAGDPFVQMRRLVANRGFVSVPRENAGRGRKHEQARRDRLDDRREVRPGSARGPRSSSEERVTGEDRAGVSVVQAASAGCVARRVQHTESGVTDPQYVTAIERAVGLGVGVHLVPERQVGGVQEDGSPQRRPQRDRRVDVVVVAVSPDDRDGSAAANCGRNRLMVVGGVDDDDLRRVADDPNVVLDLELLAVNREDPRSPDTLDHSEIISARERFEGAWRRVGEGDRPGPTIRSARPTGAPRRVPCDGMLPPRRRGRSFPTRTGQGRAALPDTARSTSGSPATVGSRRTSSA